MIILGIDPGSRFTGWGVVDSAGGRHQLVADGRVSLPAGTALPRRLAHLSREVERLMHEWQPELASVEAPFYGMNPRSLIVLAQARGAILATLATHDLEVMEYSPAEVKAAVAGSGRAEKSDVAKMVGRLLGLADMESKSADATDAIAIALCCAKRYRMDRLRASERPR